MLKFIEFLKARPSDKTIRISRIIFGLIILLLLWIEFNSYKLNIWDTLWIYEEYIKYFLFILWIVPLIFWVFDPCILKRKKLKLVQIAFWIVLIVVWNLIYFEEIKIQNVESETIDVSELNSTETQKDPVNIWFLMAFLWILPLLAWISWKCITQKCFKYWEVITKIRV